MAPDGGMAFAVSGAPFVRLYWGLQGSACPRLRRAPARQVEILGFDSGPRQSTLFAAEQGTRHLDIAADLALEFCQGGKRLFVAQLRDEVQFQVLVV